MIGFGRTNKRTPWLARPKRMLVLSLENGRFEHLSCKWSRKGWIMGPASCHVLSEGDSLEAALKRTRLFEGNKAKARMVVVLSAAFYRFHKEAYPSSLGRKLKKVVPYDFDENVFYENTSEVFFHGGPARFETHMHVPVFSMSRDLYESFSEALGVKEYMSVSFVPACEAFTRQAEPEEASTYFFRDSGGGLLDIHRVYRREVMESFSTEPGSSSYRLLEQRIQLAEAMRNGDKPGLYRVVSRADCGGDGDIDFAGLEVERRELDLPLAQAYAENLAQREVLHGFGGAQRITPYSIPALAWVAVLLVALYGFFAWSKFTEMQELRFEAQATEARLETLKNKWEPLSRGRELLRKSQEMEAALDAYPEKSLPPLALIEYLTRTTPDDTWISELRVDDLRLSLSGESSSAVKYRTRLSELGPFEDVDFQAGISRRGRSEKDAFRLNMSVNRGKLLEIENDPVVQAGGATEEGQ